MANANDENAVFRENLSDAGISPSDIDQCIKMKQSNDSVPLRRFLDEHRKQLLHSLHQYSKRIDCLDYLLYSLKKAEEED